MFYFGLRSSAPYLASLDDVRACVEPISLTSVIGGFAFLHALRPGISAVTLVDVDPDAIAHWQLVAQLIDHAESLEDFVCLLSGGHVPLGAIRDAPVAFTHRVDLTERLLQVLKPDLHALYQRSYGAMTIDPGTGHGHVGNARILFVGFDLTPMTFCWHFGRRNFADNAAFSRLQHLLRTTPIRMVLGGLETLDYAVLTAHSAKHVLLASNCDSPMFTGQDAILSQVCRTAVCPVRYVSWVRDGWIDARVARDGIAHLDIHSLPFDDVCVLALSEAIAPAALSKHLSAARPFKGIEPDPLRRTYDSPLLIVLGGHHPEVMGLLVKMAPTFRRVLWVSGRGTVFPSAEAVAMRYVRSQAGWPDSVAFELRALRSETPAPPLRTRHTPPAQMPGTAASPLLR